MDRDPLDGFSNAFTAVAVRHIDNDQGLYATVCESLANHDNDLDAADEFETLIAEQMDDFIEQVSHKEPRSLFIDLMSSARAQVNWDEIVQYYRRRVAAASEEGSTR